MPGVEYRAAVGGSDKDRTAVREEILVDMQPASDIGKRIAEALEQPGHGERVDDAREVGKLMGRQGVLDVGSARLMLGLAAAARKCEGQEEKRDRRPLLDAVVWPS